MGPFCVTRSDPTHQLTEPTRPNPPQVGKFGLNPTQPSTTNKLNCLVQPNLIQPRFKRYRDPSVCLTVCLSVCLSRGAAALDCRLAGCRQLSHSRPPEMRGLRTRPRTDVDPPRVELPSAGVLSSRRDNLPISTESGCAV